MTINSINLQKNEFNLIIEYEKNRTDISKNSFSLIILSLSNHKNVKNLENLLKKIHRKIRQIDIIGFYDNSRLLILLPSTSYQESLLFLEKIEKIIINFSDLIESKKIFSYPEKWSDIDNLFL